MGVLGGRGVFDSVGLGNMWIADGVWWISSARQLGYTRVGYRDVLLWGYYVVGFKGWWVGWGMLMGGCHMVGLDGRWFVWGSACIAMWVRDLVPVVGQGKFQSGLGSGLSG